MKISCKLTKYKLITMKRFFTLLVMMVACMAAWAAEGYAVYTPDNTTLTFYYGDKPDGAYSLNRGKSSPEWFVSGINAEVTKVIFDPSFAQARPISTFRWFRDMKKLTSITGLKYLNTSEVYYMNEMFYGCSSLTTLDLSSFGKSPYVMEMDYMFFNCTQLATLNLSNFHPTCFSMSYMFYGCNNLTSLDLSSFDTSLVTNMKEMFIYCQSLTELNLSNFITSKVTDMNAMFFGCLKLKTIYVGAGWTTSAVTDSEYMFYACHSLVGGAGTTYNSNHIDASYAHIDGGSSDPGYFTEKNTVEFYDLWIGGERVTSLNCSNFRVPTITGGSISYNPSTKTLMLEDATISRNHETCILSEINGLTITVKGSNNVELSTLGHYNPAMNLSNTTINGTGTLKVTARAMDSPTLSAISIHGNGKTLTIDNVPYLDVVGYGTGIESDGSNSHLVIKGSNTTVTVSGSRGCIYGFENLVLQDGLAITEPAGGYYRDKYLWDAEGNFANHATITKNQSYDLWIKGVQVTSMNKEDVLGDGKVSYNPSSNTLTLNEANLQLTTNKRSLESEIPGLIVNVKGINTLSSVSDAVYFRESARLTGNGEFRVTTTGTGSGTTCALGSFKDLTVDGTVYVQAANNGGSGVGSWIMGNLIVKSPTAQFRAYGKMFSLLLGSLNGVITEPEGGYIKYYEGLETSIVADASGNYVRNAWVTVNGENLRGDVNGDGRVNVSDVTALINMILGVIPKDEARADINGDGKVNVSDVTALINIILGVI